MASANPTMPTPKVAPPSSSPPGHPQQQHFKFNDTASEAGSVASNNSSTSSTQSRGRRRRNRSRNSQKQVAANKNSNSNSLQGPPPMPRIEESKPVRLQLGLNLDVELELKARLQGDVSLTLLAEQKRPVPRASEEVTLPGEGQDVEVNEMFHMRLGTLKLRKAWIDGLGKEIQSDNVSFAAVIVVVFALGISVGFAAGQVFS